MEADNKQIQSCTEIKTRHRAILSAWISIAAVIDPRFNKVKPHKIMQWFSGRKLECAYENENRNSAKFKLKFRISSNLYKHQIVHKNGEKLWILCNAQKCNSESTSW